jgi:hypothetical protein
MRKAFGFVLAGLGAITLAGAAVAASRDTHTLNVPLPDGSTARIDYVGNVAPKVTVMPAPVSQVIAPFGLFGRSAFDVERQIDAMMREMNELATHPMGGAAGMNVAAYGNAPAGATSVTIESTSNGTQTCTRRTDVISQGPGKAPKVQSSVTGNCNGTTGAPGIPNPA